MSRNDIEFLRFIASSPDGVASEEALAAQFGEEDSLARRSSLVKASMIEAADYADPNADPDFPRFFHATAYRLTIHGKDALAAEEQLAQEVARKAAQDAAKEETRKAERAEDIRRSKKQFYLGHLLTFLTGVAVGLVVAWITHLW